MLGKSEPKTKVCFKITDWLFQYFFPYHELIFFSGIYIQMVILFSIIILDKKKRNEKKSLIVLKEVQPTWKDDKPLVIFLYC